MDLAGLSSSSTSSVGPDKLLPLLGVRKFILCTRLVEMSRKLLGLRLCSRGVTLRAGDGERHIGEGVCLMTSGPTGVPSAGEMAAALGTARLLLEAVWNSSRGGPSR